MSLKNHISVCFFLHDDEILLAMNHDRPGKITWNGIASPINNTDEMTQGVIKEIYRLTKIMVYEHDLKQAGIIHYFTIDSNHNRTETLTITLYTCHTWRGEPVNATGIRPTWFQLEQIPYHEMFEDAQAWLPKILTGSKIIAEVYSKQDPITHIQSLQDVLVRGIL